MVAVLVECSMLALDIELAHCARVAKGSDRIKVLLWDVSGLVLTWKQLQHSALRWRAVFSSRKRVDRRLAGKGTACGGRSY